MRQRFVTAIAALLAAIPIGAADWPQYLGPDRNGTYTGPPIADSWGPSGPRVVWRKTVGAGFAGPIVTGGRLILFHRLGNEEVVESFDALTGAPQWRHAYPTRYRDDFGFDEGPRAVPVAVGGVVYTFGAEGQLHAIDLARGTRLWSHDTMQRFAVPKGFFGAAGSPLVEDGRVIANVGGPKAGLVAFDARTGELLWTSTTDSASYSSGVGATFGQNRRALFLTREALVGVDPANGRVAFRQPWRARNANSVNAASPLVIGDLIFVSAEYGPGAGVLRLTPGGTLETVWASNDVLSTHYATSVHHEGYLYGYHGRQELGPSLRAVELRTGKVAWSEEQFRAGSVTLAGDRLVLVREAGEIVIAPATSQGFRPLARARVLTGVVRPYPALADGYLYIRNEDTLLCLDLRR